jgi:hypothetical protein
VVLTSLNNAWKQIFIFALRCYANCVFATLTVLIKLKLTISFIVTLYLAESLVKVNNDQVCGLVISVSDY